MNEDDDNLFYVGITDEHDLCYQYGGLTLELVNQVFHELKPQILEDDFYGRIYPETCELYGFVYD